MNKIYLKSNIKWEKSPVSFNTSMLCFDSEIQYLIEQEETLLFDAVPCSSILRFWDSTRGDDTLRFWDSILDWNKEEKEKEKNQIRKGKKVQKSIQISKKGKRWKRKGLNSKNGGCSSGDCVVAGYGSWKRVAKK